MWKSQNHKEPEPNCLVSSGSCHGCDMRTTSQRERGESVVRFFSGSVSTARMWWIRNSNLASAIRAKHVWAWHANGQKCLHKSGHANKTRAKGTAALHRQECRRVTIVFCLEANWRWRRILLCGWTTGSCSNAAPEAYLNDETIGAIFEIGQAHRKLTTSSYTGFHASISTHADVKNSTTKANDF